MVTEGYSKCLTPASLEPSQPEESPEQGPGRPFLGQVLTLRLLDTEIQRVPVLTSRGLWQSTGVSV